MLSAPINLNKADALLSAEGLEPRRRGRTVCAYIDGPWSALISVRTTVARIQACADSDLSHDEADALAAALTRAAALCRRIEAECREVKP